MPPRPDRTMKLLTRGLASGFTMIRHPRLIPTLGLDLGSESARMLAGGAAGTVSGSASMPSRVALDVQRGQVVAIGYAAQRMIGRAPASLQIAAPIQSGVVAQPDLAELLIRHLMRQTLGRARLARPALVIAAPACATSVQLHALVAVAEAAGARRVMLVRESIAAALGADLPVLEPTATLLVEFGAEKTEIAVISLGGIVASTTVAFGGSHVSEAIRTYLKYEHQLLVGNASSDLIKIGLGSAIVPREPTKSSARGRDVRSGLPATVELTSEELVDPIRGVLDRLVAAIQSVLERTPAELSADLSTSGIHLSGGGSLLRGLPAFLERIIQLPVTLVDDPLTSVVRGCQRCAQDPRLLSEISSADDRIS